MTWLAFWKMLDSVRVLCESHPIIVSLLYYGLFVVLGEITAKLIDQYADDCYYEYLSFITGTWIILSVGFENAGIYVRL